MITQYVIGFGETNLTEQSTVAMLIIYNIGASNLDAVIDSISIQQARKDPE
jgi:hypothetical protein